MRQDAMLVFCVYSDNEICIHDRTTLMVQNFVRAYSVELEFNLVILKNSGFGN